MSFVEEIDITIGDPPTLDLRVYDSWLSGDLHSSSSSGYSSSSSLHQPFEDYNIEEDDYGKLRLRGPAFYANDEEIVKQELSESELTVLKQKEKLDQYRLISHLEHYFSFPMILTPHLGIWFQIPQHIQSYLIEKYYEYGKL